jgi:hypothetical protein
MIYILFKLTPQQQQGPKMETRGVAETASTTTGGGGGGVAMSRLEEALLRGDLPALRALAPEGDLTRLTFPDPDPKEVQHPPLPLPSPPIRDRWGAWLTAFPYIRRPDLSSSLFLLSSATSGYPSPPPSISSPPAAQRERGHTDVVGLYIVVCRVVVSCVLCGVRVRCARRLSTWRAGRGWWKRWPSSSSTGRSTPTCPPRDG